MENDEFNLINAKSFQMFNSEPMINLIMLHVRQSHHFYNNHVNGTTWQSIACPVDKTNKWNDRWLSRSLNKITMDLGFKNSGCPNLKLLQFYKLIITRNNFIPGLALTSWWIWMCRSINDVNNVHRQWIIHGIWQTNKTDLSILNLVITSNVFT